MTTLICQTVEITVAAHDTTGGMETKISEAALIAKLGIDVYIVKVKIKSLSMLYRIDLICSSASIFLQTFRPPQATH